MPAATSIRLFLAEGTPDGLWVVEKSNWTGVALLAPRTGYKTLRARHELDGPGVYVLIGPPEGGAKPGRVYIGETDVLRPRLDSHQANKDFWTRVIVFTAKDANLNKAHVRYLESRLIGLAVEANRYKTDNGTRSATPGLSEADRADMEAFLADMLLIYPVLGLHAFEKAESATPPAGRLRLLGRGTKAEGVERPDGFLVYAGALARKDAVPSIDAYGREMRDQLQPAGILVNESLPLDGGSPVRLVKGRGGDGATGPHVERPVGVEDGRRRHAQGAPGDDRRRATGVTDCRLSLDSLRAQSGHHWRLGTVVPHRLNNRCTVSGGGCALYHRDTSSDELGRPLSLEVPTTKPQGSLNRAPFGWPPPTSTTR